MSGVENAGLRVLSMFVALAALASVGGCVGSTPSPRSQPPDVGVSKPPQVSHPAVTDPSPDASVTAAPILSPSPSTASQPVAFRARISSIGARQAQRMRSSWHPGCPVPLSALRVVDLTYWGFDDMPHTGRLIVAAEEAEPVVSVFRRLYRARFPIHVIEPVDAFGGDDDRSMAADNTSGFNCRAATDNPDVFSQHSYGLAIDLNPFENPYVSSAGQVLPPEAARFADRSSSAPGLIHPGSIPVRAFASIGWEWGGSWPGTRDYQHFSQNGH